MSIMTTPSKENKRGLSIGWKIPLWLVLLTAFTVECFLLTGCLGLEGYECRSGNDCLGLSTCVQGWCEAPTVQSSCSSNQDCGAGTCTNGTCQVKSLCTPSELNKTWTLPTSIRDIAFRTDHQKASMITDGALILWDVIGLKQEREIAKGDFQRVRWSPDGKSVAASTGNRVLFWDTQDFAHTKTFSGTAQVLDFQVSQDNQSIYIVFKKGDNEVNLKQWDIETGKWIEEWFLPHSSVQGARLGHDRKTVTLYGNQDLGLYSVASQEPRTTTILRSALENASLVAFHPNGQFLAVAVGKEVQMRSIKDGQVIHRMSHEYPVVDVAFPPSGSLMATASGEGPVRYWDTTTGKRGTTFLAPERGEFVMKVMFLAGGTQLAYGTQQGIIRIMQCPQSP